MRTVMTQVLELDAEFTLDEALTDTKNHLTEVLFRAYLDATHERTVRLAHMWARDLATSEAEVLRAASVQLRLDHVEAAVAVLQGWADRGR